MSEGYEFLVLASEPINSNGFVQELEQHHFHVQCTSSTSKANSIIATMLASGRLLNAVLIEVAVDPSNTIELIRWLQHASPQSIRLVLVDPKQLDSLSGLVNNGAVDRLLLQPCSEKDLQQAVETAINAREMAASNLVLNRKVEYLQKKLTIATENFDLKVNDKAEELVKQVYYDELTGLAKRALLKDRLKHAIQSAKRSDRKVVLFLIGLDRFKYVNDSLGQGAGDQVLREVAARISTRVRSGDTVSRFSGDVFGLLVSDSERVEDPGFMARRILDAIAAPMKINGQDLFLTASIGISVFPEDAVETDLLLANAETAMRQAKLETRNQFRYYSGEYNQIANKRLSLEAELRRAISDREFKLYYQPRVDIAGKRVIGAESLLRWQHPDRGILSPFEFLSVLEETGLIQPVGYWVLQESIDALQRWRRLQLPDIRLAVNLSARQFHEAELSEKIKQIADHSELDLAEQRLELEITESLLMEDVTAARDMLKRLHNMGIKIAIDDFGTGYSALSYLITFPLDHLKIDKSFVDKVHTSDDAKAIVEAIVSLSYSLRLNVIAEGVETRDQLTALQSLGCKQFQGYLFAKPMPEDEFVSLMSQHGGAEIVEMAPEDRLLR